MHYENIFALKKSNPFFWNADKVTIMDRESDIDEPSSNSA